MTGARHAVFSAACALTFVACGGTRTESAERDVVALVVATEACPDTQAIERREQSEMPASDTVTSVEHSHRVPFPAKARVCWYRVTYFDPTAAQTPQEVLAKKESSRAAFCRDRSQWLDLEATRAQYLANNSAPHRMTCFDVPQPTEQSLRYCIKDAYVESFDCVEDAFVVAAPQSFNLPCQAAGEVLRYGTRIVELAAEDVLPDLAACFYHVEYDQEVSRKLGSIGYGPH